MIRNQAVLEVKKGERVYQLALSPDSPLGEVFDVISEMRSFVVSKIEAAHKSEDVQTPKE